MVKKNFFVFCAIAAGMATPLWFPMEYQSYVFTYDKFSMWVILILWPLSIGCGSLALLGIAKVMESHLIFRVLTLFVLASAASSLPIPSLDPTHGWVGRPAFTYLYANEDRIFEYFTSAYYLLIGIVAIVAFVKRKWLPGGCLLAIILLVLPPKVAYCLSIEIMLTSKWSNNMYPWLYLSLSVTAWFTIARWLKMENETIAPPEALEIV